MHCVTCLVFALSPHLSNVDKCCLGAEGSQHLMIIADFMKKNPIP